MTYTESISEEILAELRKYGQMVLSARVAREFVAATPTSGYTGAVRIKMDDNHGNPLYVIVQRAENGRHCLDVGCWVGQGRSAPWRTMYKEDDIEPDETPYIIEDALRELSAKV